MAAAGVSWTIGREGRKEFGESLAGKQYPKKKMAMSGLGCRWAKPLPFITTTDAGPDEEGDKNVMIYSFRLCVTKDAANRVPFPKPANYDPARWEILRRYFAQEKRPHLLWDLYPLPGNKFDANNGIGKQFSMGLMGACNGWSEADEVGRATHLGGAQAIHSGDASLPHHRSRRASRDPRRNSANRPLQR
jgi:hypothetical protein